MNIFKYLIFFLFLFDCNLGNPPLSEGICGDGILNKNEECDNGFANSNITPNTCRLDCTLPRCGDGILDNNEKCDKSQLGNLTCSSLGFDTGELSCTEDCNFDVSKCSKCGNGIAEQDEECDTSDLNSQTCQTLGFESGNLKCFTGCKFDLSECIMGCGNGITEQDEECDTFDLNSQTCQTLGFEGGNLKCKNNCEFDMSNCIMGCGNGITDPGEECDDANNTNEDGCANCLLASGSFYLYKTINLEFNPVALELSDNDSDGIKDIFIAELTNDTSSGQLLYISSQNDFDSTQILDVGAYIKLISYKKSNENYLLATKISNEGCTYVSIHNTSIDNSVLFNERPISWIAGKLQGKSDEQVILVGYPSQTLYFFNDGSFDSILNIGGQTGEMTFVDIFNDGIPDIAFLRLASKMLGILQGTSTGNFNYTSATYLGGRASNIISTDIESDGFADLLITDVANPYLYLMKGTTEGFSYRYSIELPFAADSMTSSFLNGDSNIDLVLGFPFVKTVSTFYGNGNWSFAQGFTIENCVAPQLFKTADITGDGLTDIVLVCGGNKKLYIYKALSTNENN